MFVLLEEMLRVSFKATEHVSPEPSHSEALTTLSSHSPEALKAFREGLLFSNSPDQSSGLGHMLVSDARRKQYFGPSLICFF